MSLETQPARYKIHGLLTEGGMGKIYVADQIGAAKFRKKVILKTLKKLSIPDKNAAKMFQAEAALTCRLNHSNIVQVFDFGYFDLGYYLAMEYVDGLSADELRSAAEDADVSIPPPIVLWIILETARGLVYLHGLEDENGKPLHVVHRDVTPSNVLLSYEGNVKLNDFGVARYDDRSYSTEAGKLVGKLRYMPPEQIRCEPLDARADLYALGLIGYELLTGAHPFGLSEPKELFARIQQGVTREQLNHPALTQEGLSPFFEKLLALDREDRIGNSPLLVQMIEDIFSQKGWLPTPTSLHQFLASFHIQRKLITDSLDGASMNSMALPDMVDTVPPTPEVEDLPETPAGAVEEIPVRNRRFKWMIAAVAAAVIILLAVFLPRLRQTAPPSAPPETPATDEAVAPSGTVHITCDPSCEILLDGQSTGWAPMDLRIPAGLHAIGLRNGSTIRQNTRVVREGEEIDLHENFTHDDDKDTNG